MLQLHHLHLHLSSICSGLFCNLCLHAADGSSECSATLDDSVSEEDEGSFDELTDVTPYLGPGVELSALNEVMLRRNTHTGMLLKLPQKSPLL